MWQYEILRFNEILSYRPQNGEKEIRRILDDKGNIVAENADTISPPFIKKSHNLKDSGVTVGKIEIYRSWRPVLWNALYVSIGGMLLAVITFFIIRILPFRALIRSQEEQRKSEELIRQLLQNTDQGIFGVNLAGNCTFINKSGLAILGYEAKDCHGENMHKLTHHSYKSGESYPVEDCPICKVKQSGDPCRWDNEVLWRRDGSYFHAEYSAYPIFDNNKIIGAVVTFSDISERKQLEKEQRRLEVELRQKYKMEAIGVMAGGMAHNFNNNLSIILGNLELTKIKLPDHPEVSEFIDHAKIAVLRSRDLVKQIMTYSRKDDQHKAPLQLSATIGEVIAMLKSTIPSSVYIQQNLSPDSIPAYIQANASQIQEVFLNLCNNAVYAMEEQGKLTIGLDSVELKQQQIATHFFCQPGFYLRLSVQDTGCGIAPELQDKIFDPFFTTKEMHEGTGMGLSTVQGMMEQLQGMITIESHVGQGTTFHLYFPEIGATAEDDTPLTQPDLPRGTERILLVDDDEMVATMTQAMLTEMGYQVTLMTDSQETLKLFAANAESFQLVITDQTMPSLTGKELILELKQIRPDIPTIICTGYSSKIDEDKAKELGINAFLMKPLALPELLQTVRRVLDREKN